MGGQRYTSDEATLYYEEILDRAIHYFQDRTEYGSYDPIFPGYEKLGKSVFQYFQDMRK